MLLIIALRNKGKIMPQIHTLGSVNSACSDAVLATSSPSFPACSALQGWSIPPVPVESSPFDNFFSLFCCLRRSRHWLCSPSISEEGCNLERVGVTPSIYLCSIDSYQSEKRFQLNFTGWDEKDKNLFQGRRNILYFH